MAPPPPAMAEPSSNPYAPPASTGEPGSASGAAPAPQASSARPLIPIFIIVFIDVMGLTLIIPTLPYYAQKYGASDIQIGLLLSSFAICQFFASPVLGRLSDDVG